MGMNIRIEIAALIVGLVGAGVATGLIANWGALPVEVTDWFKPGQIGFMVLFSTWPIGLAGLVLMCVNLFTGSRKLWQLRLLGFACFPRSLTVACTL